MGHGKIRNKAKRPGPFCPGPRGASMKRSYSSGSSGPRNSAARTSTYTPTGARRSIGTDRHPRRERRLRHRTRPQYARRHTTGKHRCLGAGHPRRPARAGRSGGQVSISRVRREDTCKRGRLSAAEEGVGHYLTGSQRKRSSAKSRERVLAGRGEVACAEGPPGPGTVFVPPRRVGCASGWQVLLGQWYSAPRACISQCSCDRRLLLGMAAE